MQLVIFIDLILFSTTVILAVKINDAPDKCLLYLGKCNPFCPLTMHPYHTRCDKDTLSQATCDFPDIYYLGYTCGWSRCDCNGNLVLDDEGVCVRRENCPPPLPKRKKLRQQGKRRRRVHGRRGPKVFKFTDKEIKFDREFDQ